MAGVRIERVSKAYGDVAVLRDVSAEVDDGEFVVLVGPSGCGKTTLLRTVAGFERPGAGRVLIGSDDVTGWPPARRGVAMVFQSYALYPHMTVRENIAFGLEIARVPGPEIAARIEAAAGILQIGSLLARRPRELSGGQRQRVAIGRAIVRQPRVFLFDEPLSNLDAELRVQMRVELVKLHERLGATMIYVTHDQVEAMTMADRIVVLNKGRVEQAGAPLDLYDRPCNLFVAGFIGSPRMNFVEVAASAVESGGVAVALPGGAVLRVPADGTGVAPGAALTLGVRPESLTLLPGASDARLPGTAEVVEHLGSEALAHLRLDAGPLLQAKLDGHDPVRRGDRVEVGLRGAACYLFARDGACLPALQPRPVPA
jgi:multiple sugar transport system ATP-binding protein